MLLGGGGGGAAINNVRGIIVGRRNVEREMFWRGGLVNNVGGLIVGRRNVKSGGRWTVGRGMGDTLAEYIFCRREMLGA